VERVTGPLAEVLAKHRDACNEKFAAANGHSGELDATAFLAHLADTVDPIVRSVARLFAERAETTALVLYGLSLELFSAGLLGPENKSPWVLEAWRNLLPELPVLVAHEPMRVTASITNAVLNIAATPGARPKSWIDMLSVVGPQCPTCPTLFDCGKVLAWRAGMAQYRMGALAAARTLSPPLAGWVLGLAGVPSAEQLSQTIERLEEDPWLRPEEALSLAPRNSAIRLVARAGAFRGFGGPFLRPPVVSKANGGLIASDGEGRWQILADTYGVVLLRDDRATEDGEPSPFKIDKQGKVSWGGEVVSLPDLRDPVSWTGHDRTLAVTIATSHYVFLLAKTASTP